MKLLQIFEFIATAWLWFHFLFLRIFFCFCLFICWEPLLIVVTLFNWYDIFYYCGSFSIYCRGLLFVVTVFVVVAAVGHLFVYRQNRNFMEHLYHYIQKQLAICKPWHWNLGIGIGIEIGTDITNIIISSYIRLIDPKLSRMVT